MANPSSRRPSLFSLHMLAYLSLRILHAIYSLSIAFSDLSIFGPRTPQSLTTKRRQIPDHLAVLLIPDYDLETSIIEETFIETVENAVQWCRIVGIPRLTVYDSEGTLVKCSQDIRRRVRVCHDSTGGESTDSDIEYPLTPPMSDHSDSMSFSEAEFNSSVDDRSVVTIDITKPSERRTARRKYVTKRRRPQRNDDCTPANPLTLHIASRESSKPAVASAARSLTRTQNRKALLHHVTSNFNLSINTLDSLLEGKHGLSSPDFMIVHPISPSKYNQTALEIHGFPPWQIRLTEIYYNKHHDRYRSWWDWLHLTPQDSRGNSMPLGEVEFRAALDEFAAAEMRLGK